MAPRGYEFTDEAFYLLNFLYWRELPANATLVGAFFELPFRLLGCSISAIRVLGFVMLLASGAFFAREALRFGRGNAVVPSSFDSLYIAAGTSASLFYFSSFGTLRVPSYNSLVLCSMLVATGLLFRILAGSETSSRLERRLTFVAYGTAIGICSLSKATSGGLVVLCHALFFTLASQHKRSIHLLEMIGFATLGVVINLVALQIAAPGWIAAFVEGIAIASIVDGRSLSGLLNALSWDFRSVVPQLLFGAVVMAAAWGVIVWLKDRHRASAISILSLLIALLCVYVLMRRELAQVWLPCVALSGLLLWGVACASSLPGDLKDGDYKVLGLVVLLFLLPLAFSFGTGNRVLVHSQQAAVFPVVALLILLDRLLRKGLIHECTVAAAVAAFSAPTLFYQVNAALNVNGTYRQWTALGEQNIPVLVGFPPSKLLVDDMVRETLNSLTAAAQLAGYRPGDPILDFTGDGPGLIFALGGRPLGVAWNMGGYSGSEHAAQRALANVPVDSLRDSWILSSDQNPLAIKGWKAILEPRLGPGSHRLTSAVQVKRLGQGIGATESTDIQLWKPVTVDGGSTVSR
jgi:hypothetical protein